MPEYVQTRFTAGKLAQNISELLTNDKMRLDQVECQEAALDKMGRGQASAANIAADTIIELASKNRI